MNWLDSDWIGCASDNGRVVSPQEFKAHLLSELAAGKEVIPIDGPCEGFDYSGKGCPGHEEQR
jgi:hypothetical protein